MKTIKVKIIKKSKPNFWYELGKTYEVQNKVVKWNDDGIPHFQVGNGIGSILCSDCEILNLNETPEYVELLEDSNGFKKGDIAKVIKIYSSGYEVFVPNRISISDLNPNVWYIKSETKPSTKEAYEKQNIIPEKTEVVKALNTIANELGYEFKIKK